VHSETAFDPATSARACKARNDGRTLTPTHAIVRTPSSRLAEGELTFLSRQPIDLARALDQHAHYVSLLREHGLEVIHAPEAPEQPDGVFVEDTLVVIAGKAILTRPGAAARRGEVASIESLVKRLALPIERIAAPGRLDGGDVLVVGRHVLVGRSSRSNVRAIAQLAGFNACHKHEVLGVALQGVLHLKSALARLPDGALIALPKCVDAFQLRRLGYQVHQAAEASGANALCLGQKVILPSSAPLTAAQLRSLGYQIELIDVSELEKLEAGLTCMSVLF
jgi:dimethylargininase